MSLTVSGRPDSTISRLHGGLGIGLTIVCGIWWNCIAGQFGRESGGKGCGATFTVILPVLAAGETPVRGARSDAAVREIPSIKGGARAGGG